MTDALAHAPSWFLVITVVLMGSICVPVMLWLAGKYFTGLHEKLSAFDEKLGKLVDALAGLTPLHQHNSAYDKLHARIDVLTDRVTRVEERR